MSAENGAGRILRVGLHFESNFTRIPNRWIRDQRLTYRARGILADLMSHVHGDSITIEELVASTAKRGPNGKAHEGRDAVRAAVAELETFGLSLIHI